MALQSLTTDTRNPILGMIGAGPTPELPGLAHLNDLIPDTLMQQGPTALSSLSDVDPYIAGLHKRQADLQSDIQNLSAPKPAPTGVLGHIGHVASGIGEALGDIFAPSLMELNPNTALGKEHKIDRDNAQLNQISGLETAEAGRKQTEATTDYTQQRPEIEQAKIQQHLTTSLAPKGFNVTANPDSPGGFDIEQDPNSPYTKKIQAATDLEQAQAERQQVMAQMGEPGQPLYEQKQRQLDQIDQRIHASLAGLGLRKDMIGVLAQRNAIQGQRLGFEEDKDYNPQPTTDQKNSAGRAEIMQQLGAHLAQQMNDPEIKQYLGPGAGRLAELENKGGVLPAKISQFKNDLVSYGAFQAGFHPVKGIGALQYFDKVVGGLGQDPEQLRGKLLSNDSTANLVREVGSTHSMGQTGHAAQTAIPADGTTKKNASGDTVTYHKGKGWQ